MSSRTIAAPVLLTLAAWAAIADAQTATPTQFDVLGAIQAATLDPSCSTDPRCGGTITVNNQVITIPRNTILQMPAAALTWQDVFALAPPPYGLAASGGPMTGLALRDVPRPPRTYEAHVVGNRVGDAYVAGLVFLSQHSLQSGQGFVNSIDYATGEVRVGGTIGSSTTGQRVRLNDPIGRFGRKWSPDVRFTIDENNPTVRSETGYPMCIPRGPTAADADARCPQANRPPDAASPSGFKMIFTMPPVTSVIAGGPDPREMAPFEVGDFVTYSGILLDDPLGGRFVAAYSMIASVGIFTSPGTDPAYVATDVTLLGVGGITTAGATEATVRTRFEGFTTDPTRVIDLYAVDLDPCAGTTPSPLRDWGSSTVDPGPPAGAVMGRWRFRPPDKVLAMPSAGVFLPATREVLAVLRGSAQITLPDGADPAASPAPRISGAYQAPISEFLFPENAGVGTPIVPNNFEDMPFLALGSGLLAGTSLVVGQLSPWPSGAVAPPAPPVCSSQPPIANAGPSQTVASKAIVTLDGTASSDPAGLALTYAWTGPVPLNGATTAKPTFVAPTVTTGQVPLTFQLVVRNSAGVASQPATVVVTVVPQPVANAGPDQAVRSGALVALDGSASTDAGSPPLKFAWVQTAGPTVNLASNNTAKPSFTAPNVTATTTLTFRLIVTNGLNVSSLPDTVDVVVSPPADTVTVTLAEYRKSKQRLTVDATSSAQGAVPRPTLTMQAFDSKGVALGAPQSMTFTGAFYEVIVVGARQPASVKVTSANGGSSTSAVTLR